MYSNAKRRMIPLIIGLIIMVVMIIILSINVGVTAAKVKRHLDLGNRYYSDMNYEMAVAEYLAAIEIDPKEEGAYIGAANAYVALGDTASAKHILSQGMRLLNSSNMSSLLESIDASLGPDEDPVYNGSGERGEPSENSADELLEFYNNEILPKYGLLSNDDNTFSIRVSNDIGWMNNVGKEYDSWIDREGIIAHTIEDLNHDGISELMIVRFEKRIDKKDYVDDYYYPDDEILICLGEIYQKEDNDVLLIKSRELATCYGVGDSWYHMSMVKKQDRTYFVFKAEELAHIFSDGYETNLYIYDGMLNLCAGVFQDEPGSDGFAYTARMFDEEGNITYEKLIFDVMELEESSAENAVKEIYSLFSEFDIEPGSIYFDYSMDFSPEDLMAKDPDSRLFFSHRIVSNQDWISGTDETIINSFRSYESQDIEYNGVPINELAS